MTGREHVFATTHWTRVLAARGQSSEAKAALGDLCAAYYAPVVAFLQGSGRTDASPAFSAGTGWKAPIHSADVFDPTCSGR
jgi:hypothetical protein